jgi:hypothetical protein
LAKSPVDESVSLGLLNGEDLGMDRHRRSRANVGNETIDCHPDIKRPSNRVTCFINVVQLEPDRINSKGISGWCATNVRVEVVGISISNQVAIN